MVLVVVLVPPLFLFLSASSRANEYHPSQPANIILSRSCLFCWFLVFLIVLLPCRLFRRLGFGFWVFLVVLRLGFGQTVVLIA